MSLSPDALKVLRPTRDEAAQRENAIRVRFRGRPDDLRDALACAREWERLREIATSGFAADTERSEW